MPRVVFTSNLQRHVDCPEAVVAGQTVSEALQAVFADNRTLKGYVLDDQGRLRNHMVIFVDSVPVKDRAELSDSVGEDSEIYVMQALTGG